MAGNEVQLFDSRIDVMNESAVDASQIFTLEA
jgi:hypothetical protein